MIFLYLRKYHLVLIMNNSNICTSPELIYYRQGMKMPDFMLIYGNKDK